MNSKKKSDYLNDIIKDDVFIDKLVTRKLYNNCSRPTVCREELAPVYFRSYGRWQIYDWANLSFNKLLIKHVRKK